MNRFVKRYGWYRGNALEKWVGNLLKEKTGTEDLSFAQLHRLHVKDKRYKDLFITATNLSKQKSTVFSWQTYPDMKIKTAVRASLSIPLYYSAVRLDEQGNKITDKKEKHDVFVDGGILANYPLSLFDKNGIPDTATLGMKLERPEQLKTTNEEIAPYEIVHFKSYVGALYNLILETLNRDSTIKHESFRTIYISTGGISPKVRKITKRQKDLLYKSGIKGATEFFQRRLLLNDAPYNDE
ncbi:MAG TPA: patatin-like phospholipase family protein [Cyclobacteriaceae bacterium]|nr:patatin-like phospholipase family protein [Cyclobacteriaceae bacterium]